MWNSLVTFHNGGNSDLVDHKITGYLVEHKNENKFAEGLLWIKKQRNISKSILDYVNTNYNQKIILKKYENIYRNVQKNLQSNL